METTENQFKEAAEHASKAADLADKASNEAQAAADQLRGATRADQQYADLPVTPPDYLNEEQGSGSTLPGGDPITRPDY